MGGYTSKVASPPPQQSFATNESTPARVHFSPELLKQLHREQEARVIQRPLPPQVAVIIEEPEQIQMERHARIERERHELAIREAERKTLLAAEEEAAQRAREVLSRLEKKTVGGKDGNLHEICVEEASRLTSMLENSKLEDVFKELHLYEECVRRESKLRTKLSPL